MKVNDRLAEDGCSRMPAGRCVVPVFAWLCVAAALTSLPLAGTAATPSASAASSLSADHLRVGSLDLRRCEPQGSSWCGSLTRSLDPSGKVGGSLSIYFEYYPHTEAGQTRGTLVATEGGPGFPATESRLEYLELFKPLRGTRDVVIMDNRGTGRSGAIDCEPLQTDPGITEQNVAQCGRSLGASAPFYSAAFATDDLAAILDALGIATIDLYGDSYGTFFAQVFATRHPQHVRSIVLDGAYPLNAPDYAWYPNYAPAMRARYDLVCQRSRQCNRNSGTSIAHILPALQMLRRSPFSAEAVDADGKRTVLTANATELAALMFSATPPYAGVRELDAAARAFVRGDRLPLLRLMAENQSTVDSRDPTRTPTKFSAGLAVAVMCQDAPQIFDMSLPPIERVAQRDRLVAERAHSQPDAYAPFTFQEYRSLPIDYGFIDECVSWPAPPHGHPAAEVIHATYPDVPALVVSGDLDNLTPVADGAIVAQRFPHGRQIIVPNGLHVNALLHSRSPCPAGLVRRFIENLDPGDTRCLASIPPVRTVPKFALRLSDLDPARASAGNVAGERELRAVAAAVFTVGDVIARIDSNTTGEGQGLRGGRFALNSGPDGETMTLEGVKWTEDLSVSGVIHWPGRTGKADANLTVEGPTGLRGPLRVSWTEGTRDARAQITGTLGGTAVAAETPAP
jgi:pimeloyl-ACP methyl ester carboxylesterase